MTPETFLRIFSSRGAYAAGQFQFKIKKSVIHRADLCIPGSLAIVTFSSTKTRHAFNRHYIAFGSSSTYGLLIPLEGVLNGVPFTGVSHLATLYFSSTNSYAIAENNKTMQRVLPRIAGHCQ
jgi:hypothetical protein